jgi:hypothetical protein
MKEAAIRRSGLSVNQDRRFIKEGAISFSGTMELLRAFALGVIENFFAETECFWGDFEIFVL